MEKIVSKDCRNNCTESNALFHVNCMDCRHFQRERRDAWVRFAAAIEPALYDKVHGFNIALDAATVADQLLELFDARFGKKEEPK